MFKKLVITSILTISAITGVHANGYVPPAATEAPMGPEPAPKDYKLFNIYVGFAGGMGWLNGDRRETSTRFGQTRVIPGSRKLNGNNASFDVYLGQQFNIGHSRFVLGIEPYFTYARIGSQTVGRTAVPVFPFVLAEVENIDARYAFGIDARPGFKLTENDILFLTLGAEVRNFKFHHIDPQGLEVFDHDHKWAFTFGGAYEHSFGKVNVGLRLKYRVFGTSTLSGTDRFGSSVSSRIKPGIFTTMLNCTYKI